jgi:acetyl esterase
MKPEMSQYLKNLAAKGLPAPGQAPVATLRANLEGRAQLSGTPEPIHSVAHRFIPGPTSDLPIRIYRPFENPPGKTLPALLYFHGGGWVLNNLDIYEQALRSLSNKGQFVVIAVSYQKAPEHKFPTPFDDCYATLQWTIKNAEYLVIDPEQIGVGGDSAGATIAAAVAIKVRDSREVTLAFQALIYPCFDPELSSESAREFGTGYGLTAKAMEWFWRQYLASALDKKNPYAVPSQAKDLTGVAPAIIITAEFDPLLDDGYAYADQLRRGGVRVIYREVAGQIHGCFILAGVTPDSEEIQSELAREINSLLN